MIEPVAPRLPTGLAKAAKALEAVFLRQLIASMRTPSLADDLFGSASSARFREMSDERLADSMAGKFGIADLVEKQMANRSLAQIGSREEERLA